MFRHQEHPIELNSSKPLSHLCLALLLNLFSLDFHLLFCSQLLEGAFGRAVLMCLAVIKERRTLDSSEIEFPEGID